MTAPEEAVHEALAAICRACEQLAACDDDAVRMFAQRVEAMARALESSVLGEGETRRG